MTGVGESASEQAKRLREKARRLEEAADKWERGAEGERRVGEILNRLPPEFVVFHDLRIPNSKANVDHLVVGPGGVWAIDTKNYAYPVTIGSGKGAGTLWTGRHRMTRTLETAAWEAAAVAEQIGHPVEPLLCIIAPSLPKRAFDFGGLRICSPTSLPTELAPAWRPPVDVVAVAAAVRHAFGAEPVIHTQTFTPTSARGPKGRPGGVDRPRRTERRTKAKPPLTPSAILGLKLLAAVLFLLFGVGIVSRVLANVGQEVGERMAASVSQTTVPRPPTTTMPPTSSTAATDAEPADITPPPPVAYTVACSLGGTSWDVSWVWPGAPPEGVAGYGVRSQHGDGPVLNHSIQVWASPETAPVDLRVPKATVDFVVITEYRDESGAVLAQTEAPFRVPSLIC